MPKNIFEFLHPDLIRSHVLFMCKCAANLRVRFLALAPSLGLEGLSLSATSSSREGFRIHVAYSTCRFRHAFEHDLHLVVKVLKEAISHCFRDKKSWRSLDLQSVSAQNRQTALSRAQTVLSSCMLMSGLTKLGVWAGFLNGLYTFNTRTLALTQLLPREGNDAPDHRMAMGFTAAADGPGWISVRVRWLQR